MSESLLNEYGVSTEVWAKELDTIVTPLVQSIRDLSRKVGPSPYVWKCLTTIMEYYWFTDAWDMDRYATIPNVSREDIDQALAVIKQAFSAVVCELQKMKLYGWKFNLAMDLIWHELHIECLMQQLTKQVAVHKKEANHGA
jgi:hypothetical protein